MWGGGTEAFGFAKDGSWREKDDKNIWPPGYAIIGEGNFKEGMYVHM